MISSLAGKGLGLAALSVPAIAALAKEMRRIPEKLKTIRKRLNLTPDQLAPRVGAKSGADILAYENNEGEVPVSVLWAYARSQAR